MRCVDQLLPLYSSCCAGCYQQLTVLKSSPHMSEAYLALYTGTAVVSVLWC